MPSVKYNIEFWLEKIENKEIILFSFSYRIQNVPFLVVLLDFLKKQLCY